MLGIWKKDGKDEKVAVKMLKDSSPAEAILMKFVATSYILSNIYFIDSIFQILTPREFSQSPRSSSKGRSNLSRDGIHE